MSSAVLGCGFLENAQEVGFPPSRWRCRAAARRPHGRPLSKSRWAIFDFAMVRPKRRRKLTSLPPAVDVGVTYRDDRDGSSDRDPWNIREPGLGAKRRYRHRERRTWKLAWDFKSSAGAAKCESGLGA